MLKTLWILASLLAIGGCDSTDAAHQATLYRGSSLPAARHHRSSPTPPPANPTDEQIRLIKAQTDAQARLAEIEARKAERLQKLAARRAETLARLEAEKTRHLKALEVEAVRHATQAQTQIATTKAQADITIEKERQVVALATHQEQIAFYNRLLWGGLGGMVVLVGMLYLFWLQKKQLKLQLHQDELRQQAWLEASRQHHEKITKLLEIIADDRTDKSLKKELTKLLKDTQNDPQLPGGS